MKRIPYRRILISIPFFLALTLCMFVLVILGTETGRVWGAKKAIEVVNRSNNIFIDVGHIQSTSLGELQFMAIDIRKNEKPLVTIENLSLKWRPRKLLWKQIVINQLKINVLTIHASKVSDRKNDKGVNAHRLTEVNLPNILINEFEIERLVSPSVNLTHRFPEVAVMGSANSDDHTYQKLDLKIRSLSENPAELKLSIQRKENNVFDVNGAISEGAGGVVAEKLSLPQAIGLDLAIQASITMLPSHVVIDVRSAETAMFGNAVSAFGVIDINSHFDQIEVNQVRLKTGDSIQEVNGVWEQGNLNFSLLVNDFPLEYVRPWLELPMPGTLQAKLNLQGDTALPKLQGEVRLNSEYDNQALVAALKARTDLKFLQVESFTANWGDINVQSKGKVDLIAKDSDLKVNLHNFDLTLLNDFGYTVPPELAVKVDTVEGRLQGSIKNPNGSFETKAHGELSKQKFDFYARTRKIGDELLIDESIVTLEEGNGKVVGKVNVKSYAAHLELKADTLPIDLISLAGLKKPNDLNAHVDGEFILKENLRQPKIVGSLRLNGVYKEIPFRVDSTGGYTENVTTIDSLILSVSNQTTLTLNAELMEGHFDLRAEASDLPTALASALGWDIQPGSFNADLHVFGKRSLPTIEGSLYYATSMQGYDGNGDSGSVDLRWDMQLQTTAEQYSINSVFSKDGDVSGSMEAKVPHVFYQRLIGNEKDSLSSVPLNGKLTGELSLENLAFLVGPDIHRFQGKIETDLSIAGTIENPEVNGIAQLRNSHYQNTVSGTKVENLNCKITASQNDFHVAECEATDDASGRFILSGDILLPNSTDQGSVNLNLLTEHANIIRRSDIDGEVSANVTLSGDFSSLLAKGDIDISPLLGRVDAYSSSGIPKIQVKRAQTEKQRQDKGVSAAFKLPVVNLDVMIGLHQQAFIRGRGLEAELKGNLYLRGTAETPRYDGKFNTTRGLFEVFGKKFKLVQGEVSFANNAIALDIEGVYEKKGRRITARLSGAGDKLKLALSSDPALPEDEILAFIIFGSSLQSISPFEAVQLISTLQTLKGDGCGSLDLIGRTRKFIGVDTLSIETEETESGESGINVGIGKYLSDRVYLEIERTANPSQPWRGNLQIELSPSIQLESSTGGQTGIEGAEIRWKKDY